MIFIAHDKEYYQDLHNRVKQFGAFLKANEPDLEKRAEESLRLTGNLNCQEQMEYSYYVLEFDSGEEYPCLEIIMAPSWYKKCYEEFGKAFTHWNHLKVYLDSDSPFNFTFRAGNIDD